MANILQSYIPKFIIDINRHNDDVITVSTKHFSPEGDVYVVDKRTVSPSVIQSEQDFEDLKPEISTVYPFKVVTPQDYDGSTVMLSPSSNTIPSASQNYYVPVWFERYEQQIVSSINTAFTEL